MLLCVLMLGAGGFFTADIIVNSDRENVEEVAEEEVTEDEMAEDEVAEDEVVVLCTLSTHTSPSGSGIISPSSGKYNNGDQITVTAIPSPGYEYERWSGTDSNYTNPTTVTMNSNRSITAYFTEINYSLSTIVNPPESGSITPSSGSYHTGDSITLTAIPASGYRFSHWSGDSSSISMPTTIIMDRDKNVVANFVQQHTLTTSVASLGSGTITLAPTGGVYDSGARVTVTATPASDYEFDRWSGDISDTNHTITITMDSDKSMVANFKKLYQRIKDIMPGVPILATSSVVYSKSLQPSSKIDGFVRLTGEYYTFDNSYEWQFQVIGPGGESVHQWKGHWINNNHYDFSFVASYAGTYQLKVSHGSMYSKNLTIEIWPPGWY